LEKTDNLEQTLNPQRFNRQFKNHPWLPPSSTEKEDRRKMEEALKASQMQ
jgi:hypothetical protein